MAYGFIANSIVEITIRTVLHGQQCLNVFHYACDEAGADGRQSMIDIAADFEQKVWVPLRLGLSLEVSEAVIRAQLIFVTRYVYIERLPANRVGNMSGAAIPSGGAFVVRKRTDFANRRDRGRNFIAGIPQTSTLYSEITASWRTSFQTNIASAWLEVLEDGPGNFFRPVIFNLGRPDRSTFITSTAIDRVIRYQRRREVGVGI